MQTGTLPRKTAQKATFRRTWSTAGALPTYALLSSGFQATLQKQWSEHWGGWEGAGAICGRFWGFLLVIFGRSMCFGNFWTSNLRSKNPGELRFFLLKTKVVYAEIFSFKRCVFPQSWKLAEGLRKGLFAEGMRKRFLVDLFYSLLCKC